MECTKRESVEQLVTALLQLDLPRLEGAVHFATPQALVSTAHINGGREEVGVVGRGADRGAGKGGADKGAGKGGADKGASKGGPDRGA
eukprot:208104-Chlamydomonas_euryale.AAC.2